jgi:hypothetical protein
MSREDVGYQLLLDLQGNVMQLRDSNARLAAAVEALLCAIWPARADSPNPEVDLAVLVPSAVAEVAQLHAGATEADPDVTA